MIIHNPILTGSFTVNGTDVSSITSSAASITAINSYTASQNILNGTYTLTSSFAAQTASFTAFTASVNSFTASQLVLNGTYATTGSNTFAGIQTVNSNLVVTGSITAQTLVVQTITSSVDFVTGSTRFGSILGNTHVFSGSVTMNPGGLFVSSSGLVGIGTINPSYQLDVRSSISSGAPIVGYFQSAGGDAQLHVSNGTVITQLTADNTNSISIVGSMTNHPLVIRTNNAERMRIASGGGVKIFGNLESLILQATTANSEIYLGLYNSAGSRRCYIGYGATPTTNLDLWNAENGAIKFGTNNTEKMRITGGGTIQTYDGATLYGEIYKSSTAMVVNGYAGQLNLQTSGTNRLVIDSGGIVTKPYQPAFNAGKNTNSTVSAGATVVFQLTTGNKFNIGGHYNASTGIFTAPVAGIYDFSASIIWMNVPNGTAMDDSFWIYKNGDIVAYGLRRAEYEAGYTGNGGYFVDFANVLLSLAVGDTVKVVNNRALEIHGNTAYSYFQGYMLG
jgi:uncharacterized protein YaiE (UPF0345 family)